MLAVRVFPKQNAENLCRGGRQSPLKYRPFPPVSSKRVTHKTKKKGYIRSTGGKREERDGILFSIYRYYQWAVRGNENNEGTSYVASCIEGGALAIIKILIATIILTIIVDTMDNSDYG